VSRRSRRLSEEEAVSDRISLPMRLMLGLWTFVLVAGLAYFIVIGLTHN
jgi:hypothetical protein